MRMGESETRFYVAPSRIAGADNGLFARVPLSAGDRLEVVGILVEPGSAADACTAYADAYKFRVGNLLLIPLGFASLVNHSDAPNCEKVIEDERVYLRAVRPIAPHEELLFTYSAYAQAQFE